MSAADIAKACQESAATGQHAFLAAALYAAYPAPEFGSAEREAWVARSNRYHALLERKAYLSAAELLVPEGWRWKLSAIEDGRAGAWLLLPCDVDPPQNMVRLSATPALALAAACLGVHAAIQAGEAS